MAAGRPRGTQETGMQDFWQWTASLPWYAWVAIVAIVGGVATKITTMVLTHRERMEAIRQGRGDDPSSG